MDNVGQALVPRDIAPHPDELRPRKNCSLPWPPSGRSRTPSAQPAHTVPSPNPTRVAAGPSNHHRPALRFWSISRRTKGRDDRGNRRIERSGGRIVIKNERQYRITKAHAEKFRATLNELTAMPRGRSTSIRSCGRHRNAGSKSQLQTGDYQTASFARFARLRACSDYVFAKA
jgi:hypothetical protein